MPATQHTYANVDQELGGSEADGELGMPLRHISGGNQLETHAQQQQPRCARLHLAFVSMLAVLAMVGGALVAAVALGAQRAPPFRAAPDPATVAELGDLYQVNASEATELWGSPSYGYGRPGYGAPTAYGRPPPMAVASSRASCCAGVPGGVCCVDYPPVCCGMQQRCNLGQCVPAAYGRPMGSAAGYGRPMGTPMGAPMGSAMGAPMGAPMGGQPMGYQRPGILSGLLGALRR